MASQKHTIQVLLRKKCGHSTSEKSLLRNVDMLFEIQPFFIEIKIHVFIEQFFPSNFPYFVWLVISTNQIYWYYPFSWLNVLTSIFFLTIERQFLIIITQLLVNLMIKLFSKDMDRSLEMLMGSNNQFLNYKS